MKEKTNKKTESSNLLMGASVNQGQQKVKKSFKVEEDEPRDDFEGFGSITAMV